MLLMLMLGMILLGALSQAAVVQEVDYEAQNYYNGDYVDYDVGLPSSFETGDARDDYAEAGACAISRARGRQFPLPDSHGASSLAFSSPFLTRARGYHPGEILELKTLVGKFYSILDTEIN